MVMSDSTQSIEAPIQKPGSRRKLYLFVVIVLIAALSGSVLLYSFRPVEAIALALQYEVGEKMTYEMDMTVGMMGVEASATMSYSIEVLDKEGDIYTVRMTMELLGQGQTGTSYSMTMKITESGELVELVDAPEEVQQAIQQSMSYFSFMPGNGFYFPLSEARVGDSWPIPINVSTEMFDFTGTMQCAITETRALTVPAGTYDVFKLEITSSDLDFALNPEYEQELNQSMDMQMTMNGYEYIERGTCRMIQANFDTTMSMAIMNVTATMDLSMNMQLTEHIRP
jgi:hypothetical protein